MAATLALGKGRHCRAKRCCRGLAVAAIAVLTACHGPLWAAGERVYRLRLPAASAHEALDRLANETEYALFYVTNDLERVTTNALDGSYTLPEALDLLLEGSPLNAVVTGNGVIVVSMTAGARNNLSSDGGPVNTKQKKSSVLAGITTFVAALLTNPNATAQTESAASQPERGRLEEVIVTAERRESNVQEVPISITVLNEKALDAYRIKDVVDIANHTPNFFFNQSRPSAPGLTIRGIGSNARQGQAGVDLSVIVYVDDVYIGRGGGQVFDLFDVERVEVLRGPQGTLFGRNAAGGAVHVITKKPAAEPYAKLQASVGNYDFFETKGALNSPISDTLFAKFSWSTKDRDGVNDNIFTGNEIEDLNSTNARGQLRFVPTDDFSALLTLDYSSDKIDGVVQRPINGVATFSQAVTGFVPAPGFRQFQNAVDGFLDRDIWGISAHLDWETSIGTLTSVTAFRNVEFEIDFPGVGASGGPNFSAEPNLTNPTPGFESRQPQTEDGDTFTQELRLASRADGIELGSMPGRLQWLAGAFYMNEDVDQVHEFKRILRLVGAAAPTSSHPQLLQESEIDSFALFGSATWLLSDAWRFTLGARQTWETRKMKEVTSDLDPLKLNTNSIAPILELFSADNEEDWDNFMGAATISFFPQSGVFAETETMFYASVSEGFKSGGFDGQASSLVSANTPFLPEESINYEGGFKSRFFDDRVQFNGTAFWTDFENMQLYQRVLTIPGNQASGTNIIVNLAEARIRGFEAEAIFLLTPQFTVTANMGYQDAEMTDATILSSLPGVDPDGLRVLDGSRLPRAPKYNYFVSAAYDIPVGDGGVVTLLASDRYTDDVYFEMGELKPGGFQEGYHLFDASITWAPSARSQWRFMLWSKNLFDEEYYVEQQQANGGLTGIGRIGEPRTYGITAEWSWN